jgi:hypothetical protein
MVDNLAGAEDGAAGRGVSDRGEKRNLGEAGGFRGRSGRWAADGGGRCDEASREQGRPWVVVRGGRPTLEVDGWMRKTS